jgi:hypothetical protein
VVRGKPDRDRIATATVTVTATATGPRVKKTRFRVLFGRAWVLLTRIRCKPDRDRTATGRGRGSRARTDETCTKYTFSCYFVLKNQSKKEMELLDNSVRFECGQASFSVLSLSVHVLFVFVMESSSATVCNPNDVKRPSLSETKLANERADSERADSEAVRCLPAGYVLFSSVLLFCQFSFSV